MALIPFRYMLSQLPYEIGTISSPLLRMRKTRHKGIKSLPPKAIVYRISNCRAYASNSLRTSYTRLSPKWTFCPGLCVWHQYVLPCPFWSVLKCLKCQDKQQYQRWQTAAHRHCYEMGQPFCGCALDALGWLSRHLRTSGRMLTSHMQKNNCWAWHFFCTSCRLWRMLTLQPRKSRAGTTVSTGLTPSVAAARFLHVIGEQKRQTSFQRVCTREMYKSENPRPILLILATFT